MNYTHSIALKEFLESMITEDKLNKFDSVLQNRTRYLTMVLEDIYQPHNASAVLRSCDCFGVQDVHIIENRNTFSVVKDIALGSAKWLSIKKYNQNEHNTADCLEKLKLAGYAIIGTTPHKNDCEIEDLPLNKPTAIVMGTEKNGLSRKALDLCDGYVKIPMVGFTESLNISVCAAIMLENLTSRLRKSDVKWTLNEEEKLKVYIDWCFAVTGSKDLLLERFKMINGES